MLRQSVALLAAAACLGVLAPAAVAAGGFVPYESIGPVSIGQPLAETTAAIGVGRSPGNTFGSKGPWYIDWAYHRDRTSVPRVSSISYTGRAYRTARGIGVGSLLRDAAKAHPSLVCQGLDQSGDYVRHFRLGNYGPNRRPTFCNAGRLEPGFCTVWSLGFRLGLRATRGGGNPVASLNISNFKFKPPGSRKAGRCGDRVGE